MPGGTLKQGPPPEETEVPAAGKTAANQATAYLPPVPDGYSSRIKGGESQKKRTGAEKGDKKSQLEKYTKKEANSRVKSTFCQFCIKKGV